MRAKLLGYGPYRNPDAGVGYFDSGDLIEPGTRWEETASDAPCRSKRNSFGRLAWRGGEFLVAGYTFSWDTRDGAGTCDINYLTGKGVLQDGIDGKPVPFDRTFEPVRLADWTVKSSPDVCDR